MHRITSRNNPKIKFAASLKKSAGSEFVLTEGVRLCEDAAKNGVEIESCFLTQACCDAGDCEVIMDAAQSCFLIEESVCSKLSDTKHPQGVFCVCKKPHFTTGYNPQGKYLFLENIRDPGNFGTIIRTAEAFGLDGMMVHGCCDAFSPKVLRASMGAVFRLPLIATGEKTAFIQEALAKGMRFYCSVVDAAATDVRDISFDGGVITAVGNEANGLSEELLALGQAFTIHMAGRAESFNASQAATVMMYEMTK